MAGIEDAKLDKKAKGNKMQGIWLKQGQRHLEMHGF